MKLSPDDVAYLDGLFDPFDNLPDGAWQAACEDAAETCGRFPGVSGYDVWMAWVDATAGRDL